MGIVETMVGILIGMIVVLAIYNVFALAEGYKRTTVGVADAQTTGLFAQFVLAREIGNAGTGIALDAANLATCTLVRPELGRSGRLLRRRRGARHSSGPRAHPRRRRREPVRPAHRHLRHAGACRQFGHDRRQADGNVADRHRLRAEPQRLPRQRPGRPQRARTAIASSPRSRRSPPAIRSAMSPPGWSGCPTGASRSSTSRRAPSTARASSTSGRPARRHARSSTSVRGAQCDSTKICQLRRPRRRAGGPDRAERRAAEGAVWRRLLGQRRVTWTSADAGDACGMSASTSRPTISSACAGGPLEFRALRGSVPCASRSSCAATSPTSRTRHSSVRRRRSSTASAHTAAACQGWIPSHERGAAGRLAASDLRDDRPDAQRDLQQDGP